jgi:hypothetical protein
MWILERVPVLLRWSRFKERRLFVKGHSTRETGEEALLRAEQEA